MIRKFAYISVFCLSVLGMSASCLAKNYIPFFLTHPVPNPTPAATTLNLEHPFRCDVKEVGEQNISMTIPVQEDDFTLVQFAKGDALPRFEVNGFSFEDLPVDEAVQALVDEAGITVYTEGGAYPEMSGQDVYGELSDVLDELTKTGGVFYSYDASQKALQLSKNARFELKLPANKLVMFAVLDAIRGADITTATPDWHKSSVLLTLNQEQKEVVEQLVSGIVSESQLLLLDIGVYQLNARNPKGIQWQKVVDDFGVSRIHSEESGLVGKVLTMGHHKKADGLINALKQNYTVDKISQGVAIVPHTWKMRFDVGRCAIHQKDINSLSFLLNTNIQSSDVIETNITLDTLSGEISAFNAISGLDDEIVILGIPASVIQSGKVGELLVTLKIRLIRLVSEGK